MLLSKLAFPEQLEIYNEKEFEVLALVVQNPQKKYITFVNEKKYISKLNENVSMVITKPELKDFIPLTCGVINSENPTLTFFKLHNFLENNKVYIRSEYKTVIGKNCKIGKFASIAESNVIIGNNVVIEDFVTIYPNTTIGDNVIIRSGAKIGGQGYEYKRCSDDTVLEVNHYGGVIIEHDVDIHSNTCIARAVYPWDNTVVGEYSKISSLVVIGHGVKIGKRVFIAGGSVIGGRTEINDNSWLGIGVTVKNALKIKKNVSINMGSVLANDLQDGKVVSGNYAVDQDVFFYHQLKVLGKR